MTKRSEKRLKLKKKFLAQEQQAPEERQEQQVSHEPKIKNPILRFYDNNYKILLIIPIVLFLLAIAQISFQMATNDGDFINKDISLKGGTSLTIPSDTPVNPVELQEILSSQGYDTNVKNVQSRGKTLAFLVESDIDLNDQARVDGLIATVNKTHPIVDGDYSLEGIGASIGESFFKQAIIALIFSFILMGLIVAITFRTFIPSVAVILAALSDIIITLAIVNMLGIKVSTAGLAAFLMLIGYSVDTDILLTTRVLKRKEGSVLDRIVSAFKTGITMNLTTLIAVAIALFISSSEVIKQIMTILFIGILVDQISTWIQNAGILRLHVEHKKKKDHPTQ